LTAVKVAEPLATGASLVAVTTMFRVRAAL
jgi:hypothetical protein